MSMAAPSPLHSLEDLRSHVIAWRKEGTRVALIPTMGALHRGHLAHVPIAKQNADKVIVSIFVNPAQFAPNEDFDRYPRTLMRDAELLGEAGGVDLIYAPAVKTMYPDGFATEIKVGGPSNGLESDFRPHFFAGVATVVTKLFLQVAPDVATFGEKDYQQLQVVRRLVRDLDLPIYILPVPTLREHDGLAMSSRNAYLTREEREVAAILNQVLRTTADEAKLGTPIAEAEGRAHAALSKAGFGHVDYVSIRDAETLEPVVAYSKPARILAAAWLGKTRLIDNMAV
jgi:pantoate--beta-alanine ligase